MESRARIIMRRRHLTLGAIVVSLAALVGSTARQARSFAGMQDSPAPTAATKIPLQSVQHGNPEFLKAADEVLVQMSQLLGLPVKAPLKKSLRSKKEIREYLVREDQEDKSDEQRYADQKALEAFGLIPSNFPLDAFMLDVLTDQVYGPVLRDGPGPRPLRYRPEPLPAS